MTAGIIMQEALPAHGELRAYRIQERREVMIEVFREQDGRAWQLRLSMDDRPQVTSLVTSSLLSLDHPDGLKIDAEGMAVLGEMPLGPGTQLAAILLVQDDDQAFALWRRERMRDGSWSWTIDLVLVPSSHARQLCAFVKSALSSVATVAGGRG